MILKKVSLKKLYNRKLTSFRKRIILEGAVSTAPYLNTSDHLKITNIPNSILTVTMFGGGGVRSGGYGKLKIKVTPSDILVFDAGCAGDKSGSASNGALYCACMGGNTYVGGTAGAGASVMFFNGNLVAVVGGAGGSSTGAGGYGGGFNTNGGTGDTPSGGLQGGGAGTTTAGGASYGTDGHTSNGTGPFSSMFTKTGGDGGWNVAGAGGGGYYGGGGAANNGWGSSGGGGGGSGYLNTSLTNIQSINTFTDTANTKDMSFDPLWNGKWGVNSGPGAIIIEFEG